MKTSKSFLRQARGWVVWIVAAGRREQGDRGDVYELARRLFRQGLL